MVVTDFPGATGVKRRPVVVLSSDNYHRTRPDVIIGVITSRLPSENVPTDHVLLDWSQAGLRVPSMFRAYLATVPQSAVSARIGHLSDRDWAAVRGCVKNALAELF